MIILEGPDGSGKSTLAAEFKLRGCQVKHFGVPPIKAWQDEESIFQFFFQPLRQAKSITVFDRLHLSDRIYAPLMRGSTPMSLRNEHLIERYVEARDGQIIICLPPRRVAFANWLARKKKEYVKDIMVFHKVYDAYARLLFNQKRNRNFLWFDYTRHRAASIVSAVIKIEGQPLPSGMVGSQRPRFFINAISVDLETTKGRYGRMYHKMRVAGYKEDELTISNLDVIPDLPLNWNALCIDWSDDITIRELTAIRRGTTTRRRTV
jgi:thymidylate kinase